jgi:hypothetical protein
MSQQPMSPKDDQSHLQQEIIEGPDGEKTIRVDLDSTEHTEIGSLIAATIVGHVAVNGPIHPINDRPFIDSPVEKAIREGRMPGGSEGKVLKEQLDRFEAATENKDPNEIR